MAIATHCNSSRSFRKLDLLSNILRSIEFCSCFTRYSMHFRMCKTPAQHLLQILVILSFQGIHALWYAWSHYWRFSPTFKDHGVWHMTYLLRQTCRFYARRWVWPSPQELHCRILRKGNGSHSDVLAALTALACMRFVYDTQTLFLSETLSNVAKGDAQSPVSISSLAESSSHCTSQFSSLRS